MEPRISMITLGVGDLKKSTRFYEQLGFEKSKSSTEGVTFFKSRGAVLGLYSRTALAEDAAVSPEGEGFRGIALAHNVRRKEEVDMVLLGAKRAGGIIVKDGQDVFWGGYCGYFSDPDGHLWEVAWNPNFPMDAGGIIRLPE